LLRYYTSESVSEGHPDKLADFISDSILDEFLRQDPQARVACETLLTTGLAVIAGEITLHSGYVDIPKVVREAVRQVGYTRAKYGFDAESCAVMVTLDEQSPDIAGGVNYSEEWREMSALERENPKNRYSVIGAGDQGLMFGYATRETEHLMPLPITLAHGLTKELARARKSGQIEYLRPDAKAQVTVVREGDQVWVDTIVISTQHAPEVSQAQIRSDMLEQVIPAVVGADLLRKDTKYFINPSGKFVIGGPQGDAGLTGRKIIVDTYGGAVPHGGGAFSGKDPTKVDRSAAYYARYIAKNLVAAGLADRALVEVAYAIGRAQPVSLRVDSFGTGKISDEQIAQLVHDHFDPRPQAIIAELELNRPIYAQTAAYGHFGRPEFPWEQLDKVAVLQG
jgi:S-adenosylmethionine synthetase